MMKTGDNKMTEREARTMKRDAYELHVNARKCANPVNRFSIERDDLLADLAADGYPFDPTTIAHISDIWGSSIMATAGQTAQDIRDTISRQLAGATDALLATTYRALLEGTTYLALNEPGRYVAMAIGSELSHRHPDLDALLEAWVDDFESEATYESVVLDYLTTQGM